MAPTWARWSGRSAGPLGFVVLRDSYLESMSASGVADELNAAHREAMLHAGDPGRFEEMCAAMKALVHKAGMSDEVRERILAAYRTMGPDCFVAVRSSATGEDGADASFAGMNETYTNIRGEADLIDAVQNCWASLFGPRVVAYRASRGFSADPAMAVVVQQMIASERSGVAFTADPTTDATDRVVVEGAFGQGVRWWCPGRWSRTPMWCPKRTARSSRAASASNPSRSSAGPTERTSGSNSTRPRPRRWCSATTRCADRRYRRAQRAARRQPAGHRMGDRRRKTYIVQTRPITTLSRAGTPAAEKHEVLVQGLPAVPGRLPVWFGCSRTSARAAVSRTARCWWPR